LNGELNEKVIHMKQPPGYFYSNSDQKVLYLHKVIYGLKQSSRRWY
jgi:hypothetical protein